MRMPVFKFVGCVVVLSWWVASVSAGDPAWVDAMRDVHARSKGEKGVFIHLGDSITYSMAYFAPLQYAQDANMSPATRGALQLVDQYMRKDCYRWKGGEKGNYSGQTASWGLRNVESWIASLKPEVAFIMFGTNDIRQGTIEAHEKNLRALVQNCLDHGVVVILSTIPPMHGFDEKVQQTVEVQRKVAADLNVPLVDFYTHVINRRPRDWDGTLEPFESFSQWEVPTIISKDGVHPSNPKQWQKDYTEEGLARNGNVLRSYLTLMAYAEVIHVVVNGRSPTAVSTEILGPDPKKPANAARIETPQTPATDDRSPSSLPTAGWFPTAPPLAAPTGETLEVATVEELFEAAEHVKVGATILVADGLYRMPRTLVIKTDGVSLRGRSGNRANVVLDFTDSRHHEGVAVSYCRDVTIANLTVQNVRQNGIKINSNLGVDRVTIYNVVSHNVWQRHIKGPGVPDENGAPRFVEDCRVQCCLFYNDRAKQRGDEPWEDTNSQFGFNYVGGMDIMGAKNWVVSDNVFTGIHGKTGEARGAIFFWHNGTGCVIERNVIIDCDSGICLGNSSARGERRHANGFFVRNNFVVRCAECNILADHTRDCRVVSNTVHDPDTRNGRLLRAVHANDGLVVANNIFSGPRIVTQLNEGPIEVRNNLIEPVGDYFVDAAKGDLHLRAKAVKAIDQAVADRDVRADFDQGLRGAKPDLGADEWESTGR